MNDLDICKRIAEIEGFESTYTGSGKSAYNHCISLGSLRAILYNPLTDDALCFRLMVKYSIELTPLFRGEWCASFINKYTYEEDPIYGVQAVDERPNRAICLAIIEAHKESNND
jgi:hypothetical protein